MLPTPAGHWLPNSQCIVNRKACATGDAPCKAAFERCKLTPDAGARGSSASDASSASGDSSAGDKPANVTIDGAVLSCQPRDFVQPCNWAADAALLGLPVFTFPYLPVEEAIPFVCSAGAAPDAHAHPVHPVHSVRC